MFRGAVFYQPFSLRFQPIERSSDQLGVKIRSCVMKIIVNRVIYTVGLITLIFLVYTLCFYLVATKIVYPYESGGEFKSHPIRPAYNVIFRPLRWVKANGMSIASTEINEYYGWLTQDPSNREHDSRSAAIDNIDGSLVSIGFTGKEELLKEFDNLKKGQYVQLTFGVALDKKTDTFINELVSYKKIDLPQDPRIRPDDNESDQENDEVWKKYSSLTGEARDCTTEYLKKYEQKVLEHCLLAGYANGIGGGCHHTLRDSINTSVLKSGLHECNIES